MSYLLASLLLALSPTGEDLEADDDRPSRTAVTQLQRGVTAHRCLHGVEFQAEAMQEAWCLVLEQHPEVWSMTDEDVRTCTVQVPRQDGRIVDLPLERRLLELGIKARNIVLRDNHLNRQTRGQIARFTDFDDAVGDPLDQRGRRVAPKSVETS